MRRAILLVVAVAVLAGTAFASKKSDPRDGRQEEAGRACFAYLQSNSKDPSSFEVDADSAKWELGHGLVGKNDIWVTVDGRGKNTYGAVLQHTFSCEVECKKDVPCHVTSVEDAPR